MTNKYGIAIVGGSGYGAGELLRILSWHPNIEVAEVISQSHAGKPVASIHSHLAGVCQLSFSERLSPRWHAPYQSSAVVCSVPTGHSLTTINELLGKDLPESVKIIDLSGDLRLSDQSTHSKYYPEVPFSEHIRAQAIYGLPELGADKIKTARLITNPGCLATAAILALAPLSTSRIATQVAVDGKTGTSGAGRSLQPSMHHPSRAHDCSAYKVLEHRHEPEILQALGPDFSARQSFMFVPHLLPVSRGCLVTCYISCTDETSAAKLPEAYRSFYRNHRFIRFREEPPRLVDIIGTNFCDLQVVVRGKQAIVSSAIDNLGKGMAGQCIQNLNLIFGLPTETGLIVPAIGPV